MNPQNPVSRRTVLSILAAAPMAAGCARGEGEAGRADAKPAPATDTAARAPKKLSEIVVGFSQTGAESSWRVAHGKSIQEEAEKRHIQLLFADGQNVHNNQVNAVNGFITKGVDILVIAPQESLGWKPTLKEAKRAGIPVVLTSRGVDAEEDLYTTVLVADFVWEGRQAGEWLAERTKGNARIIELVGTPAADVATMRKAGFAEAIAKHPDMKIIASQSGDFTRTKGKAVMETLLSAHKGEINAVYAHNDDMALGAIQAIEAAGLKPGQDILVVSVDAVKPAFEAMTQGKLNATVECNPMHGPLLFDTIEKIVRGEKVPKQTIVPGKLFEREQAAALINTRPY
ncbi:LacI family transcriptional regulator [Sorangium cellulosum]|uniref:LacI family transcriptional regulator n=1 Tax=Sorangium cellulosum TaxID=56 RepID=A0A2L0ERY2_SORCE|nr:ABC transporter substrate-binding protein [Sorangium cellulosum]AUX42077.1 LacI family transcriptional regulator [Sorangium cellulosum]